MGPVEQSDWGVPTLLGLLALLIALTGLAVGLWWWHRQRAKPGLPAEPGPASGPGWMERWRQLRSVVESNRQEDLFYQMSHLLRHAVETFNPGLRLTDMTIEEIRRSLADKSLPPGVDEDWFWQFLATAERVMFQGVRLENRDVERWYEELGRCLEHLAVSANSGEGHPQQQQKVSS
jgi:hypothetical protein